MIYILSLQERKVFYVHANSAHVIPVLTSDVSTRRLRIMVLAVETGCITDQYVCRVQ